MQWEVDNQHIDVLVRENGVIEIVRWDDHAKIIYIPANMPKSEALWSIRSLLSKKRQVLTKLPIRELYVFGKRWPVVSIKKSQKTYMKEGIVYSYLPVNTTTFTGENRVKNALLQQVIFDLIDKWEHFYSATVPEIKFRKTDRRPFSSDVKNGRITFDKDLHRFAIEQIEYAVFLAITAYIDMKTVDNKVLQRHFPDRKITEKIFKHEYTAYDYD